LAGREEDIMADDQLGWSDAQWEMVNNAVGESFAKASVAGAFLDCYGPLGGSVESVRNQQFRGMQAELKIRDAETLLLFNLTVKVTLSSEQVADDSLSSAVLVFRRAANTLAQVEDELVFNGFDSRVTQPVTSRHTNGTGHFSPATAERIQRAARAHAVVVRGTGPARLEGLAAIPDTSSLRAMERAHVNLRQNHVIKPSGEDVVTEVTKAIGELEATANPGPFACVLGRTVFVIAHTPVPHSMVLPADRITPMLGGPLLRAGSMSDGHGVVVSLAGNAIDIVVATPPKAQFLQMTLDAGYLFRVYERFVLRIKDQLQPAVYAFEIESVDTASDRVRDLIKAGRLDLAEQAAEDVLKSYPGVHNGLELSADVYAARADRPRAREYYKKALDVVERFSDQYDDRTRDNLQKKVSEFTK
jgi:uncharacterized linocin/CFP29 family protein